VKRLRDNPQRFAEIARPFLHAVIAIADEDGGGVTPAAAERALRVLGVEPGVAAQAARELDADHDGRIGEEEILTAFAAYYVTPEPS
jgi:hypothetical protein